MCKFLGGSWVGINGVIGGVSLILTLIRGRITPLITTHEPPSKKPNQAMQPAHHPRTKLVPP